jgi:hypothetical protein
MNAHKIASLAGMATMAASAMVHLSIPAVFVQAGQGAGQAGGGRGSGSGQGSQGGQGAGGAQPSTPQTSPIQPRTDQPAPRTGQPIAPRTGQPATPRPGQTGVPGQPGTGTAQDPNAPGNQGLPGRGTTGQGTGAVSTPRQRLFALDNNSLNNQLMQSGQRLANFETQLNTMNQQLLTQLGQARQLSGPRREEALAEVVQQMLIQQRTMLQFLGEMRVSLTGDLQDNGLDQNGNPLNPDAATGTGNGNGVANPANPGIANPGAANPNGAQNNPPARLNPGRPTTNPSRLPAQPTRPTPQNPSEPTTNPSGGGGG